MKSINVKCRPSIAHWGLTLVINGGVLIALFVYRLKIASMIIEALRQAKIPQGAVYDLPFWLFLGSIPILIIARTVIWALTTEYEITSKKIRIVHGGLVRKEQFVDLAAIKSVSFEQNIIEAMFKVGRLLMTPYSGEPFTVLGVPNVSQLVEDLRERLEDFPQPVFRVPSSQESGTRPAQAQSQPQQVIVQQKSSGCMTCLVILLIIIVLPMALGVIFNITVITGLVAAAAAALSQFFH